MKRTNRIASGGCLLVAALFIGGCADKQSTAPDEATLDLSRRPSFNVSVNSTIETLDPDGRVISKREFTQRGNARPRAGQFRANIAPVGGGGYDPAVTPVVAVQTEALWSDYDETVTDSAGNVIHIVARGPGSGAPVDNVWVWVNGQPRVRANWIWRPAVGGYTLYRQTVTGLPYNLEPTIRIESVVNSSNTVYASAGFGTRFGEMSTSALNRVACWLAPKTAYANLTACWWEATKFSGETFALGVGSVALIPTLTSPFAPWAIAGYFTGWGLWTGALYDLLNCLDHQIPRRTRRPNRTEITNAFGF